MFGSRNHNAGNELSFTNGFRDNSVVVDTDGNLVDEELISTEVVEFDETLVVEQELEIEETTQDSAQAIEEHGEQNYIESTPAILENEKEADKSICLDSPPTSPGIIDLSGTEPSEPSALQTVNGAQPNRGISVGEMIIRDASSPRPTINGKCPLSNGAQPKRGISVRETIIHDASARPTTINGKFPFNITSPQVKINNHKPMGPPVVPKSTNPSQPKKRNIMIQQPEDTPIRPLTPMPFPPRRITQEFNPAKTPIPTSTFPRPRTMPVNKRPAPPPEDDDTPQFEEETRQNGLPRLPPSVTVQVRKVAAPKPPGRPLTLESIVQGNAEITVTKKNEPLNAATGAVIPVFDSNDPSMLSNLRLMGIRYVIPVTDEYQGTLGGRALPNGMIPVGCIRRI